MPHRGPQGSIAVAGAMAIVMLTAAWPVPLRGQAPGSLNAMAIPPQSVGTCIAPAPTNALRTRLRLGPRLVITTQSPSGRREMELLRDSAGTVVGFSEMVDVSTGRLAGAGEIVIATLRPEARVAGYVLRFHTKMSDSDMTRFDTASLRRMRENAAQTSSRSALDVSGQGKVRALVSWLAKRCPG